MLQQHHTSTTRSFLVRTGVRLLLALCVSVPAAAEPERIPYPLPAQHRQTWTEVFANPKPITLTTLQTGVFRVDPRKLLDADDAAVEGFEPSLVGGLPVYVHLLEHSEQGAFLIDTGFGRQPHEYAGWLLNAFIRMTDKRFDVPVGEGLGERLGDRLPEIRAAFLTHLHFDHVSGARELAPGTKIVVARSVPSRPTRVAMGHFLDDVESLSEIDFSQGMTMEPLGRAVDLLGDGSLWALETPGHTLGHMSFLVNAERGPILLTGDVSHFGWGFERDIPSVSTGGDADAQRESLRRLRAFVRRFPRLRVIFGHELPSPPLSEASAAPID